MDFEKGCGKRENTKSGSCQGDNKNLNNRKEFIFVNEKFQPGVISERRLVIERDIEKSESELLRND
jgi:hypothetical protein